MSEKQPKKFAPKIPAAKPKAKPKIPKANKAPSAAPGASSAPSKPGSASPTTGGRGAKRGAGGRPKRQDRYTQQGGGVFSEGIKGGARKPVSRASAIPQIVTTSRSKRVVKKKSAGDAGSDDEDHLDQQDVEVEAPEANYAGEWLASTQPRDRPVFLPLSDDKLQQMYNTPLVRDTITLPVSAPSATLPSDTTFPSDSPAEVLVDNMTGQFQELLFFQFPQALPRTTSPEVEAAEAKPGQHEQAPPKPSLASIADIPEGAIGSLRVRRSGKVEMCIGDVVFDVTQGVPTNFLQDVVVVDTESSEPHIATLGSLQQKFVVSPTLDALS
eukprot:m.90982 g.90982  ORF g.90982 m.90982 type:complete len:327 (+) comp12935_c0_seq5:178-1158(+)